MKQLTTVHKVDTSLIEQQLAPIHIKSKPQISWLLKELIVVALYLAVAVAFTWPLVLHLREAVSGPGKPALDPLQTALGFWILRHNLEGFQDPFFTTSLFHPYGTGLYLTTYQLFHGLIGLPVQYVIGGEAHGTIAAYNFVELFAFTLSGYGAFCLARYIIRPVTLTDFSTRIIAFFGGLSFGFSSYQMAHARGHLNLISVEFIPFYILFLLKTLYAQGHWWKPALIAGLFLFLNSIVDLQFVIFLMIFTFVLIFYQAVRLVVLKPRQISELITVVKKCGTVGLLAAIPAILVFGRGLSNFISLSSTPGGTLYGLFDADLLTYFRPSIYHFLWGNAVVQATVSWSINSVESVLFPTYIVLFLALGYLFFCLRLKQSKSSKRSETVVTTSVKDRWYLPVSFWWVVTLFFGFVSLGDYTTIAGKSYNPQLPSSFLHFIPIVNIIRVQSRYGLLVILALTVLAAYGLNALLKFIASRNVQIGKLSGSNVAAFGFVGLLLFELWPGSYSIGFYQVSDFYKQIATEPNNYALMELPYYDGPGEAQSAQIIHNKSLIGGYLARYPNYELDLMPVFKDFRKLNSYAASPKTAPPLSINSFSLFEGENPNADVLRYYDVRYIIVRPKIIPAHILTSTLKLINDLGLSEPVFQDEEITVYRVADNPTFKQRLVLADSKDWEANIVGQGRTAKVATPTVKILSKQNDTVVAAINSVVKAQSIEVWLNNQLLKTVQVGQETGRVNLQVPLVVGENRLVFKFASPATTPLDVQVDFVS